MSELNVEALRTELVDLLAKHDWHYAYADDSRAFSEGASQRKRIYELVKLVPDGESLYAVARPAFATY